MKVVTFIHQLYATERSFLIPDFLQEIGLKIFPDQVGFVTPVEISLTLQSMGIISKASRDWMIKNVVPRIVAESRQLIDGFEPMTFPRFKKCEDFRWHFENSAELSSLIKKIEHECN